MSGFGRYGNGGEFVLGAEWDSSNALISYGTAEVVPQKWESDFWKRVGMHKGRGDVPLPCMYKNKPYLRGGLNPTGEPLEPTDFYIADFNLKYHKVKVEDIRVPTDAEYEKHFQKIIEDEVFLINAYGNRNVRLTKSMESIQNDRRI